MRSAWLLAIIPGILLLILGVMVLVLFLVKILWSWVVPDLFPGAVQQGLIARDISWYTAFKISIFIAVLAGISRAGVSHANQQ
jgi:hypothetical protein